MKKNSDVQMNDLQVFSLIKRAKNLKGIGIVKFVVVVLILFTFSSNMVFSQAANRIKIVRVATVDIAKLLDTIKKSSTIENALRVRKSEELLRINELIEEIGDARFYLEDNAELLTEEKIKEIEEEILLKEREVGKLNGSVSVKNSGIGSVSSDAIRGLYQLIKKEAQVRGFSLVLEKRNAVIYVDEDLDLTADLNKKLEELANVDD